MAIFVLQWQSWVDQGGLGVAVPGTKAVSESIDLNVNHILKKYLCTNIQIGV